MIDQFLNASLAVVIVVFLIWVIMIQISGFTLNQFF